MSRKLILTFSVIVVFLTVLGFGIYTLYYQNRIKKTDKAGNSIPMKISIPGQKYRVIEDFNASSPDKYLDHNDMYLGYHESGINYMTIPHRLYATWCYGVHTVETNGVTKGIIVYTSDEGIMCIDLSNKEYREIYKKLLDENVMDLNGISFSEYLYGNESGFCPYVKHYYDYEFYFINVNHAFFISIDQTGTKIKDFIDWIEAKYKSKIMEKVWDEEKKEMVYKNLVPK